MAAKHACLRLTGGILSLLAGVGLHSSILGAGLILVSAATLGWVVGSLVHPWLGKRVHYRVRYHAPDAESLSAVAIGQGLATLARQSGAVAVIWRREGGELTLFIEVPATLDEALRGMLPRLLPGVRLEAVSTPPALSGVTPAYRWPLTRAVGSNQVERLNPLNFGLLLSEAVFTGDLELRVHILAGGASVVVRGSAGRESVAAGLRPFWPLLSRRAERLGGSPENSKATRRAESIRLMHPRSTKARYSWPVLFFRAYPFVDAGSYSSSQSVHSRPMHFPATGGPGARRLSSQESYVVPLPDNYSSPAQKDIMLLGVATADGRRIGVPLLNRTAQAAEPEVVQRNHFLVIGEPDAEREATVRMMVDQVVGSGGGLLYLDPSEDGARRIAAQLPPATRPRRGWIDMENPAGSLRMNLLSVPPVEGKANSAASEAAALVSAIADQVPLLGAYLVELGVSTWVNRDGSNPLLDWARVLLIAHHRARIAGDVLKMAEAPAPDFQTLYELLNEPEALSSFVAQEAAEWASLAPALAARLALAGADGAEARTVAQGALLAIDERLSHMGLAYRGLLAASLRDQLRPALHHPSLSRLWRGPFRAPPELLGREPGPVLVARLPLSSASPIDVAAARWYGSYLIACFVATARWRLRGGGRGSPPILLVLQDASSWLSGGILQTHLDLLGRARIAVLATCAELPEGVESAWLLDNTGTWWLHSLSSNDSVVLRRRLRNLGVQADLSLSNLPSGVAVLKFPDQQGPTVVTVYTGKSYVHDTDPAPLSRESQHGSHASRSTAQQVASTDTQHVRAASTI